MNKTDSIGDFLYNSFFIESFNLSILFNLGLVLAILVVSLVGVNSIGGQVYMGIMKSGLFSSNNKRQQFNIADFSVKKHNPLISNVKRDIKTILRIPEIRNNAIITSIILSVVALILMVIFKEQIMQLRNDMEGRKVLLIINIFLLIALVNIVPLSSFSREGRSLSQFKVYPISNNSFILSKIIVSVVSHSFGFIAASVFSFMIASNFREFIVFEITTLVYVVCVSVIISIKDLTDMNLKWNDIKDLLTVQTFKILIPAYIFAGSTMVYPYLTMATDLELKESYSIISMFIFTFFYLLYSLKKFKRFLRQKFN